MQIFHLFRQFLIRFPLLTFLWGLVASLEFSDRFDFLVHFSLTLQVPESEGFVEGNKQVLTSFEIEVDLKLSFHLSLFIFVFFSFG